MLSDLDRNWNTHTYKQGQGHNTPGPVSPPSDGRVTHCRSTSAGSNKNSSVCTYVQQTALHKACTVMSIN